MSALYYCCRVRAGDLVKECRALRPRFAPEDTDDDHRGKALIKRYARTAVSRSPVDRLELRLALIGPRGIMYTLTFDDEHLPKNFIGVRKALRAFLGRVRRWRESTGKPGAMDYIYCIEGLHGKRRYHIHFICSADELSPAEVVPSESGDWPGLWRAGIVDMDWVLFPGRSLNRRPSADAPPDAGAYRRLAKYLNKERTDGYVIPVGRHPWSASKTLTAKLPEPERWRDESNVIEVPANAVWVRRSSAVNDFGSFYYASWIEPRTRATDYDRAQARASIL